MKIIINELVIGYILYLTEIWIHPTEETSVDGRWFCSLDVVWFERKVLTDIFVFKKFIRISSVIYLKNDIRISAMHW